MDFKHFKEQHHTPISRNSIVGKVFSSTLNYDSPFRNTNYSTPPSRFTKIKNPFETHLIERLHLPTFSPSVFTQISTPKTEEKFVWTIDDISSLKPVDIDEETISQHVEEDPHVESMVQEKINKFFQEKVIVPSPMVENSVKRPPIMISTPSPISKSKTYSDGTAQTILTLPPNLPEDVEKMLEPFCTYTKNQQQVGSVSQNSVLYRQLFEFDVSKTPKEENEKDETRSVDSSPARTTSMSPIQFSPLSFKDHKEEDDSFKGFFDLEECSLSPIGRPRRKPGSFCRANLSGQMSIDGASMIVPDVGNQMSSQTVFLDENAQLPPQEILSNSEVHWEMEYKHITMSSSSSSDKMDISNPATPHSRMFTSQRKRLSDSFKDDVCNQLRKDNESGNESIHRRVRNKVFIENVTESGYFTSCANVGEDTDYFDNQVFASTPTRRNLRD